jgi:hypothetical protein
MVRRFPHYKGGMRFMLQAFPVLAERLFFFSLWKMSIWDSGGVRNVYRLFFMEREREIYIIQIPQHPFKGSLLTLMNEC